MTDYDKKWKIIDSLVNKKGLTRSALEEADKLYQLAKAEHQEVQVIKALLYRASLQATTEETGTKIFDQWQQEINTATEPARSVLQSILAEKYQTYFQSHRYNLYNRTATVNFVKEDIETWGVDDFHKRIATLYSASLKADKRLQQTKLEAFDPLIVKGNVRYLRPSLYDLLANRALNYFKNDERTITKPADAFEITDARLFAPAAEYTKVAITTTDTASLFLKALLVYQQLLAFHLHDPVPDALIDADIQRLQFIQQHAVMEAKDKLYQNALTAITDQYPNVPAAAQAAYLLAQMFANKAALYNPFTTDDKDSTGPRGQYILAAAICRQVLQQKEQSEGKANCNNLLQQIEKKQLKLVTEKVNVPQQAFRTLVSYRNFSNLYLRLALLTEDLKKKLENRYDDNYWKDLASIKPLRGWDQALPATSDYQQHSTEIKVDALPAGQYILLASTTQDFAFSHNPIAVQYFYVSGISYINKGTDYFILNRESGKPLAGALVQTWWTQYDYNTRTNKKVKGEKQGADKNGYLRLTKQTAGHTGNMQLEIGYENDRLFMNDGQYSYYREETINSEATTAAQFEKDHAQVFFFTDRSIYRPGQMLYFKGVVITKDFSTRKNKIYSGALCKIMLRNANGEDIDSLSLKTNEYGSYAGKFILPKGTLNGVFTLTDESMDGNTSFSVEEYKRPSFFVAFDKIKGTYKVNDSITLTGFAKAYAGNNIDGAQVKYRVQRVPRFIYPWLYWKTGYPQAAPAEISHGIATTNANGQFTIRFKAIPDLSIAKNLEPVFDYNISADLTDINGETRSGETTLPVSYKSLQLKINLPATLSIDSLQNVSVSTQNLQGEFEPARVQLSISKLQSPARLIRKRYWQQPDQFVISRDAFVKDFPNDEYENESDYRSWPVEKKLATTTDSSTVNTLIPITHPTLQEGWYVIEAMANDAQGIAVKDVQYVQLFNEKSKNIPTTGYTWSNQKNNSPEPGEQSIITVGTAASDVFLIQETDKMHPAGSIKKNKEDQPSSPVYNFIKLNGKQSFSFAVTEADRGGFAVIHFFVKDNRFYSISNLVQVPWTNKELQISYETFRDKTLPGSNEQWKLKISGYKKEKVAAEMLVSMYDASLDQFKPHSWMIPPVWENYFLADNWESNSCFNQVQSQEKYWNEGWQSVAKTYDYLNTMDNAGSQQLRIRGMAPQMADNAKLEEVVVTGYQRREKKGLPGEVDKEADVSAPTQASASDTVATAGKTLQTTVVQIRRNFNETAFFFPDLKTDSAGNISFGFTIPEALTQWKFQSLAHTKDLAFGYSANSIVTQKPLMVQPNAPRFLREGDKMELSAKLVNLTDKELTGTVTLDLINTASNQPVDGWFRNMYPTQYFTAEAGQSTVVKFSIDVPYQYNSAVSYRFVAKAGDNTDGEEAALPVLTNSLLVTESMPLPLRGNAAKNFRFEKLIQSGNSETLQQHALTVEFTTNPAWYAVQALPYLMDYPYECAEQTFNRYYANAIAAKIINNSPRVKEIIDTWRTSTKAADTTALLSNLQKNPELKAALLEETPWVMEAKNETQQKKNIALLFDMVKMSHELAAALEKLKQMQSSNGGFVWFKGGPDDRFITQYILTGIGHLKKLGALNLIQLKDWTPLISNAIGYLDKRIKEDYDNLAKHNKNISENHTSYTAIQYLYMRSFFTEYNLPGTSFTAVNYYRKQSQQYWLQQNKYMQGMIALSLFRSGDLKTAADILKSLKQNAVVNEELGMYWKDNTGGYYWHQAPVATQSLLIEAFTEINKDTRTVNDLKTWLLKQKQTQNWTSTKATAEACYALLLQGSDWLTNTPAVEIRLGDKKIITPTGEGAQAGTGYFKQSIDGPFVKPAMGEISVKIAGPATQTGMQPAWGAVYWQYFEQLDKITPAATPLKLEKQLFIEKNSANGPLLEPLVENGYTHVGDKIKVRIVLRVDRDMEYVHMKDMRASCLEPVNVLSGYKWQGGLGYYESTRDASTNFFFNWLPKGVYVFEYPLFVTHAGNFSNGITSVQCMYAPEFASHSEGIRINTEVNN